MKVAAVSEDGVTISQHFGRAPFYVVVTVEDDKIVGREQRPKMGHHTFAAHEMGGPHRDTLGRHGYDAGAQSRHASMASAISDCQVLLARGMGAGAYDSMRQYGIKPIVTDIPKIDDAVKAYIEGRIVDHTERLD